MAEYRLQYTAEEIDERLGTVNDNKQAIEGLINRVIETESDIDTIETNVSTLTQNVNNTNTKIGLLDTLTTGVKDTVVNAINWLNNSLSTLSTNLSGVTERVSKNETDISNLNTNLSSHTSNKSNPHGITAAQIGLGNVSNTADSKKSVKYATSAGSCTGNAATSTNATNHISNKSNPHGVTKAQIGLGNVDNTKDSVKYVNMANFLATQTVTESALDNAIYTGLYFVSGVNGLVLHLRYDDNFAWQIWFSYGDYIYVRRKAEGNWLDWKTAHSW